MLPASTPPGERGRADPPGVAVGARDEAIHLNRASAIRLLPDPTYPITWGTNNGTINPYTILAYTRIVPIEAAPEYQEGAVSRFPGRRTRRP